MDRSQRGSANLASLGPTFHILVHIYPPLRMADCNSLGLLVTATALSRVVLRTRMNEALRPPGRPLKNRVRVYVYESNISCTHSTDKVRFEQKLDAFFASSSLRTRNPAHATIFYHPACLVDVYLRTRWRGELAGPSRVSTEAQRVERAVLRQISELGFSHRPHVVNSLRCFPRGPCNGCMHMHGTATFPTLWGPAFRRFCLQAKKPVDESRSCHMPYCVVRPPQPAPAASAPASRPANRSISVLFIGTPRLPNKDRECAVRALRFIPGARVVSLLNRSESNGDLRELMRDATFTLCPAGDTPESERIYQAIARGSIPLLDEQFQPPPLAAWSRFSATITFRNKWKRELSLPSPEHTARLQQAVKKHARRFECRADDLVFQAYIRRALHALEKGDG